MKVLVVEDDEFTRTLLVGALSGLGHDCVSAVDGLHGWSHVQTSMPDMIICDWRMPGFNGMQLCAKVRALGSRTPVWFLLMAAVEDRGVAMEAVAPHAMDPDAMTGGVDDYLLKPVDLEELRTRLVLADRWVRTHRELAAREDEVALLGVQLRESAERDPLTRCFNRLRLTGDMGAVTDRAARYGHAHAVALIDIDHFRAYNETYGHTAGDEALVAVADLIDTHRRAGDTLYRYGGEEFLLLLPEQNAAGARVAAERIRRAVATSPVHHSHLGVDGHVTVSIGIAQLGDDARAFEEALQRADHALHAAKERGRNRTVIAAGSRQRTVER